MKALRLSTRLGLSVALLSCALLLLLGGLSYWILHQELEFGARKSLEEKLSQINHSLMEQTTSPWFGNQGHQLEDLIRGHDNLSLTLRLANSGTASLLESGELSRQVPTSSPPITAQLSFQNWITAQRQPVLTARQQVTSKDGQTVDVQLSLKRIGDHHLLDGLFKSTLLALPLVLLLIAAGSWWVVHRGLAPLRKFRRVAAKVSTQDLSHRLQEDNLPQELAELASSINFMLQRLDNGVQQLTRFSDDLAHELRSPISNLIGKAQVTLSRPRSNEQYQSVLESCTEELNRTMRIVADMLFLANVSHPAALLNFTPQALEVEAARVIELFSFSAEDKQISLNLSGAATVAGDRLMLQRAISNLLSNAIRHSPEGSQISLSITQHEQSICFTVSNPGPGIAPEHLGKVFERFYRVDRARARVDGGTGLGLAIVRSIMGLHGGKVEAHSELAGMTHFRLYFPAP